MQNHPLIRTIYLYLFSLIGLVLIVIGVVGFVQMGLKMYVFTQADQDQRVYNLKPTAFPFEPERLVQTNEDGEPTETKETVQLTEHEQTILNNWIKDYERWQERNEKLDPLTSRRHQEASKDLAMILIGLPLYLYHWRIIKKETNKKEQNA